MRKLYKLTQTQFDFIVEQCDAVLTKYAANTSIAGIAWLHVLNSHPSNQAKYVYVFNKRGTVKSLLNFVSRSGAVLADLFLSLIGYQKNNDYKQVSADTQILFISHLVNVKAAENDPDFYYQELPEYLETQQQRTAIALLNHTKGFKGWAGKKNNPLKQTPQRFVFPRRLGFYSECILLSRALSTALFFIKQAFSETNSTKKYFFIELAANTFSVDTLRAFRIHEIVKHIIQHTNIQAIALTWEGHSWERLVCHAAKTAPRKILSIGYQHTILFPSSHALKRSFDPMYDPDRILTVGEITKNILASSPGMNQIAIKEYGSPRLKEKKKYTEKTVLQNGCLVAPEGLIDECIRLFTLGIETAKLLPDIHFIFRTHPTMRFEDLQINDTRLQNLPSNIIISSFKNIDDDFARCSWVVYRSSSVSFFATLAGLRPLYLTMDDELSVDPLYALKSWRLQVKNAADMVMIINADRQTRMDALHEESKEAILFCETYMLPYNIRVFADYLRPQKIAG
jgi:hypothetical protein